MLKLITTLNNQNDVKEWKLTFANDLVFDLVKNSEKGKKRILMSIITWVGRIVYKGSHCKTRKRNH